MAFSLLSTARCIGKSARLAGHSPCNPEIDFVLAKTLYRVQHSAGFSTSYPSLLQTETAASILEVNIPRFSLKGSTLQEQDYGPPSLGVPGAPSQISNTKLKPGRRLKSPNWQYPAAASLAKKILRDQWGHSKFRLDQEAVVSRLIAGGSAAVVFPTGSGKSLLYQIPALAFDQWDEEIGNPVEPGITLVISPLIALMKDQTDDLVARGIKAATIDSSKTQESVREVYDLLRSNELKLLYCSPERLNSELLIDAIQHTRVRMIAVDEAHCVFEWGDSFRPEYLKVARFVKEIEAERVLCLTATATPEASAAICSAFGIPEDGLFRATTYRPNLHLLAESFASSWDKIDYLKEFLTKNRGASIVYVTYRVQAEDVAQQLADDGFEALPYHAGMSPSMRSNIQEQFMKGKNITIVATIAFGLGINKPDIRNVIHYDYPRSLEGYSQEIGRAGRDSKKSKCMLFLCPSDLKAQEYFQRAYMPNKKHVRGLLRGLFKRYKTAEAEDIIELNLLAQSKNWEIQETTLSVLYAKLELHFGLLRAISSRFSNCVYKPLKNFDRKVKHDDSSIAQAIITFSQGNGKKKSIDVNSVADDLDIRRELVVQKLEEWDRKRIIELRSNGVISRYRMLKPFPEDPEEIKKLIDMAHDQMRAQKAEAVRRSGKVIELFTSASCFARGLAEHFGDVGAVSKKGCGKCQWCRTKRRLIFKRRVKSYADRKRIDAVLAACPDSDDPELLAKVAYGIKSSKTDMAIARSGRKVLGSMADCDFDDLVYKFSGILDLDNVDVDKDDPRDGVEFDENGEMGYEYEDEYGDDYMDDDYIDPAGVSYD